jgi:exodeoxyribonuclease V alpha subunit
MNTTKLEGYVKKIYKCVQQDDDDENISDNNYNECNNSIYFVLLEIIDNNNKDHTIKGYSIIQPEKYDYITCVNYNIIYNKAYDKNNISTEEIIKVDFPRSEELIVDRLVSLKIPFQNKSTLTKLVNKYKQSIWNIQNIIDDKSIDEDFINKVSNYINKKINNEIKEPSYILNYLIDTFNLSLSRNEYKKVQEYINPGCLKFPLSNAMNEKIVLHLSGCINNNKLENICSKMELPENIYDKINIIYKVRKCCDNGHSCITKSSVSDIDNIDELVKDLVKLKFIDLYEDFIYDRLQFEYETFISKSLKQYHSLINNHSDYNHSDFNYSNNNQNDCEIELNEEQNNALISAFKNPISIITGGPGYGKTFIIKKILAISKENGFKFTILGPTGKVVDKIYNDLELKSNDDLCTALTVHKFINIKFQEENSMDNSIRKFAKMENNKMLDIILKSRFIIIDEMSMISNKLFTVFFKYIFANEIKSKLIFIGDVNQLPSIDCGAVLNCLIESNCFPVVNLVQPMRHKESSSLVSTINNIKIKKIPKKNSDYQFIKTNNKTDFNNKFMSIISELLEKDKTMDNLMIISPTHKNIKDYSDSVRKLYHEKNNTEYDDDFSIGDHIILTKNIYLTQQYNYTTDITQNYVKFDKINMIEGHCNLFNGMVGKIIKIKNDIKIKQGQKLTINYYVVKLKNGYEVKFEKNFFNQKKINKMSYINTVHKYQGSENDTAIVILTEADKNMASNNLIYTAMSRAKKNCIVIGEEEIYHNSIKKKFNRISNLNKMIMTIIGYDGKN